MARSSTLFVALATLSLLLIRSDATSTYFTASCNGSNEIPATNSPAKAMVGVMVGGTSASWTLQVTGISNLTMAHIHAGNATSDGPILVKLLPNDGTNVINKFSPPKSGNLSFNGTFTAANLLASLQNMTLADFINFVETTGAYINVHTTQNPGGEVRGQLVMSNVPAAMPPPAVSPMPSPPMPAPANNIPAPPPPPSSGSMSMPVGDETCFFSTF